MAKYDQESCLLHQLQASQAVEETTVGRMRKIKTCSWLVMVYSVTQAHPSPRRRPTFRMILNTSRTLQSSDKEIGSGSSKICVFLFLGSDSILTGLSFFLFKLSSVEASPFVINFLNSDFFSLDIFDCALVSINLS